MPAPIDKKSRLAPSRIRRGSQTGSSRVLALALAPGSLAGMEREVLADVRFLRRVIGSAFPTAFPPPTPSLVARCSSQLISPEQILWHDSVPHAVRLPDLHPVLRQLGGCRALARGLEICHDFCS